MRKTGKWLATMVVTAAMAASLAGCASETAEKNETTQEQGENTNTEEKSDSSDVTLRFAWWGGDSRHEATLAAIEAYEKEHPNVKIEGEYQGYDGYYEKMITY